PVVEQLVEAVVAPTAIFGHLSYGLLVASMMMQSIVWLRIVALVSGVAGIFYSGLILHDPVGTGWEAMFVAANVYQLAVLAWQARSVTFSDEEMQFCQNALPL